MSWTGIFQKFGMFTEAKANKQADKLLDSDPLAVMKLENEHDADAINSTHPQMDQAGGELRRLSRQLNDEEQAIANINAKIDAALTEEANLNSKIAAETDPAKIIALTADRDGYTQGAQALQTLLAEKQATHDVTTKSYAQTNGYVSKAKAEVQQAVGRMAERDKRATSLGQQLELSQTVVSARKAAEGVAKINLGGVGGASKAEQRVQQMIDTNMASLDNGDIYTPAADPTQAVMAKLDSKLDANRANASLDARRAKLGLKPALQPVGAAN